MPPFNKLVVVALFFDRDAFVAFRQLLNRNAMHKLAIYVELLLTTDEAWGPAKYGGGGQPWNIAYQVIRKVAEGDGSLGMLLGYHLLWSWTANVVGTDEQKDRAQKNIIENNYFIGGESHIPEYTLC